MMLILPSICIFILGLILGSFYHKAGLRVPKGESAASPSSCPSCQTRLSAYDFIPLLSYAVFKGRCRDCGADISAPYPWVGLVTGLMFVWVFLRFEFTPSFIAGLVLVSLGVIVTVTDLTYMKIPNKVLLTFLPVLLVLTIILPWQGLWSSLLGAATGLGITFLLAFLTKGMGMGDVKLFTLFGWILGFPQVIAGFLIASVLGSMVGGLFFLAGKAGRKQRIPFAPWLSLGAWLAFAYGEQLIAGYLSLIG